jgi:hypothetical protein
MSGRWWAIRPNPDLFPTEKAQERSAGGCSGSWRGKRSWRKDELNLDLHRRAKPTKSERE